MALSYTILAAFLAMPIVSSVAAPTTAMSDFIYPPLLRAIDTADEVNPPLAQQLRVVQKQLDIVLSTLQNQPNGIPITYQPAFAMYARQFNTFATNPLGADVMAEVQSISDDLQIKAKFVAGGFGLIVVNKSLVSLMVRTVDERGRAIPGYQVQCNPRRYAGLRPSLYPFSGLTSTQRLVPPGAYTLEVTNARGNTTIKDITVGMSGGLEERVEVLLPATEKP